MAVGHREAILLSIYDSPTTYVNYLQVFRLASQTHRMYIHTHPIYFSNFRPAMRGMGRGVYILSTKIHRWLTPRFITALASPDSKIVTMDRESDC